MALAGELGRARKRRDLRTAYLYARALVVRFRWSVCSLVLAVVFGGTAHWLLSLPHPRSILTSYYDAWMALLGENVLSAADPWPLVALFALYPIWGFVIIGEGIVRLALLLSSREQAEKEWMKVMASTYRDHTVLCGVGHLGFRVLQQLVAGRAPVVAVEKDPEARFLAQARALKIPILLRDMKEDEALIDAGVPHARTIVIATNDDIANLEVALDARHMNPQIRIVMRLFDQQIAAKISGPLSVDVAFSSSALAAPIVAAMALEARVLATFALAGVPYLTAELTVRAGHALVGHSPAEIERAHEVRILARNPAAPAARPAGDASAVRTGEVLVVHGPATRVVALIAEPS